MRRGDLLLVFVGLCALLIACTFVVLTYDAEPPATEQDVTEVEETSQANREVLASVETSQACIVALLYVPPEDRPRIDPAVWARRASAKASLSTAGGA